jgi:hypothetical protein
MSLRRTAQPLKEIQVTISIKSETYANVDSHLNRLAFLERWFKSPPLDSFYCIFVEIFVEGSHNPDVTRTTVSDDH